MATKCPKCQFENMLDSKFCKECGTQLIPSEGLQVSKTLTLETKSETLTRGAIFAGRYEVLEELGSGGMGAVYRVYDQKLEEEVALKLIRPEISTNRKAIERFKNELKVARKIIHKSVCRMYDLGETEGASYITMEYVRGEDLKSLLHRTKALAVGTALIIARQVAEGLAEAHGLGVVHRDLKPGNIMIDKEGNAKIMDFGIARSLLGKGMTGEGAIIGTPEYMSPEQVEGKETDARSDIYSLGIILFEMIVGRAPFEGNTPFSIANMQKTEAPPIPKKLVPHMPDALNDLILRCLEKDRAKRCQSAEKFLSDLETIEQSLSTTDRAIPKRKTLTSREITVKLNLKKLLLPALALIVLVAVIALAPIFLSKMHPQKQILPVHEQVTFTGNAGNPEISPDGKFMAYTDGVTPDIQKVMVQDAVSGQTIEVFRGRNCSFLRWSPDGSELSFCAESSAKKLATFVVPRLGGKPRQLDDIFNAAWCPDGSHFAHIGPNQKQIQLTDRATRESRSIVPRGDFSGIYEIDVSPSGKVIVFFTWNQINDTKAIWTIGTDGSGQNKIIEKAELYSPRWSPRGDAIYYLAVEGQSTDLWRMPVSTQTGKPTRPPSLLLQGLQARFSNFSIDREGKQLLYVRDTRFSNIWLATVEGSEKNQRAETKQLTTGTSFCADPSLSPDAKSVAFARCSRLSDPMKIYVIPTEGGSPQQITFMNGSCDGPAWSPDGTEIAFDSKEGGSSKVWKMSAHGGKPYQFSKTTVGGGGYIFWAPGPRILYEMPERRNYAILDPRTEEEILLINDKSVGRVFFPKYSPDGKKVAVLWNRKPGPDLPWEQGIWIISLEDSSQILLHKGVSRPLGWSPDGRWIYTSEEGEGKLRFLMISAKDGHSETLFSLPLTLEMGVTVFGSPGNSPDGKHFVFTLLKIQSDVWVVKNFDQISR